MSNSIHTGGLNSTPSGDRVHIGIFGRRNAGKSSVINAMTGQSLSIVSDVKGTTTDPVQKAMELLPLGPVVMIDTPGIDDEGELGSLRVQKSYQVLNKTDIAVLVIDGMAGFSEEDASPWKCGYRRGTVSGCAGEDLCMDGSDIVTAWTFWHSDYLFYYDSWIGRSCYRSFSAGKPLKLRRWHSDSDYEAFSGRTLYQCLWM